MLQRAWKLAVLAALPAAAQVGCAPALSPEAEQVLADGRQALQRGADAEAIERMDRFLADYPAAPAAPTAEAHLIRGTAHRRAGDVAAARNDLNAAVGPDAPPQVRGRALALLGDLAYDDGEMALAENLYREALGLLDTSRPPADRARLRLGVVLQRQGRWEDADAQFNRLIYDFADTPAAAAAGRRVHCTAWTVQAGAFRDRRRAEELAAALTQAGLDARISPAQREDVLYHRVQIGRQATYEQAERVRQGARQHQADAFVTVTR